MCLPPFHGHDHRYHYYYYHRTSTIASNGTCVNIESGLCRLSGYRPVSLSFYGRTEDTYSTIRVELNSTLTGTMTVAATIKIRRDLTLAAYDCEQVAAFLVVTHVIELPEGIGHDTWMDRRKRMLCTSSVGEVTDIFSALYRTVYANELLCSHWSWEKGGKRKVCPTVRLLQYHVYIHIHEYIAISFYVKVSIGLRSTQLWIIVLKMNMPIKITVGVVCA